MPRNQRVKLQVSLYPGPDTTDQPVRDLLLDYEGHQGYNNLHYNQLKNARCDKAQTIFVDQPKTPQSTAFRVRMPAVRILDLTRSSQVYSITCRGILRDVMTFTRLLGLPGIKLTPLSDIHKHLIEICDEYNYSYWFTSLRIESRFSEGEKYINAGSVESFPRADRNYRGVW